jgi:N-carbamoylputrescine amidase
MPTKIAAIQMSCTAEKQPNLDKAADQIRAAAASGAQIICLQELFATHYPCQAEDHEKFKEAEPLDGPTCSLLSKLAADFQVVIVGSMFEKRAAGLYHNTAVVWEKDGKQAGVYRKMHIPDDPLYYEKFYFTPGDLGFKAIETSAGTVGVCVCWDQWFPEAARLTALAGADVLFYPTAIGWLPDEKATYGPSQVAAWQTMMRSHAIANGVFVVAANRVGTEGPVQFWGHSFVVDPYGNVMTEAGDTEETILSADCDFELIDTARTHWPFLRDRRIDAYDGLLRRFGKGK